MTSEFDSFEQKVPPADATVPRTHLERTDSEPPPDMPGIQTSANNSHDGPTPQALDRAASHAHDFVRAKDSPRISAARTGRSFKASEKYRAKGIASKLGISAARTPASGSRLGTRARDAVSKINETKEKATIIWKPRKPGRWMMQHRPAVSTDPRANAERARLDNRLHSERDAFVGKQAERLAEFRTED